MSCRWTITLEVAPEPLVVHCTLPFHAEEPFHENSVFGVRWQPWSPTARELAEPRFVAGVIPSSSGATVLDRKHGLVVATFHRDAHPNDTHAAKVEAQRLSELHDARPNLMP
jgi:hypothetical protein